MNKKITIQKKPNSNNSSLSLDSWVSDRGNVPEHSQFISAKTIKVDMKRFTIDVPSELHKTIKKACAERGTKMADEIRDILTKHYQ